MFRSDVHTDCAHGHEWSHRLVQCPVCRSAELKPRRFENASFDQAASAALTARQAGRPAHAVSLMLVWIGVEAINRLRAEWECLTCGKLF
jgi:hypothetical protein